MLGSSALKPVKPVEWQRQQLTEAVLRGENSCHSVTCGQGGSGSKRFSQKDRTLSDPSSLHPTPCCHHFDLFAHQVTSLKFLAAYQSSTGFLSCGKSFAVPLTLPVSAAKQEKLVLKARWYGKIRAELPHPGVVIFYFYIKTEILIFLFAEAVGLGKDPTIKTQGKISRSWR